MKMAEHRKARDAAERELFRLGEEANKRKAAILEEREEAGKLRARIDELKAEYIAATNALEAIFREDEELSAIAGKIGPLQKTVEESQVSLNREVATAMQIRMAAQRAAWEKANPAPKPPEESAPAEGAENPAPVPSKAPVPATARVPEPWKVPAPAPVPEAAPASTPAPAPAPTAPAAE